ncbi:hypothetical protein [Parerythrobacter aestuarii]|uniref:hypothetical protein n=1 Tax=Parerythrobacter aestuarii TaxID=3020909 RepID=UPI0024DECF47|nr:hypothetical protein [Parerythrobacter aestuarii]
MGKSNHGPTFQQWVGTYDTVAQWEATSFSPLELRSDGTLLIAGTEVDYTFDAGRNAISIAPFTLVEAQRTLTVSRTEIGFSYKDAQATFGGSIWPNPASGGQDFSGHQKPREMVIPEFFSDVKMSTALYNDHLHVVGAARVDIYRTHLVIHRQFPLKRLIPTEGDEANWNGAALADPSHWSKELWQPAYWEKLGVNDFKASFPEAFKNAWREPEDKWASSPRDEKGDVTDADITSLVSIGGALYCFYTYSDSSYMSLRARQFTAKAGDKGGQWGQEMILFEPQDDTAEDHVLYHTGAVSAVAFGDTQILVAACGTGDTRTGDNYGPGYGKLMFYLFDISDTNNAADGKGWAALSGRQVDVNAEVDFYLKDQPWKLENRTGVGFTIDADWIIRTVPDPKPGAGKDARVPQYFLAISYGVTSSDPAQNQHTNFTWQSHVPLEFDDSTSDEAGSGKLKANPWGTGRLTAFSNQTGKMSSLKRDASGRLQSFGDYHEKAFAPFYTRTDKAPEPANQWCLQGPTDKIDYYGTDDHTRPSNLFYTYPSGQRKTETTGVNLEGQPTTFEADEYPILEFICYGKDKIQLHDYGSIRTVSDKHDIKQKDRNRPVYQIGGYFDGPAPFPLQNFKGIDKLTGDTAKAAAFEYGKGEETGKATSTESTWNVGMEAEGKVTKGVGLGFKVGYEYEDITKDEKEIASARETALAVDAKVINTAPYDEPEAEGAGSARTLSAQFHVTGFQFANRWGALVSDGLSKDPAQSPKLGRVLARMQSAPATNQAAFHPSLVTAGDLESYTAEAIDAKMGENYVRDTICRNAYVFEGGQPFLMYSWNNGNMIVETAESMTKSFTSHEWSHGGEAYAGVSGGVGANIFGFGEEYEFSVMAGGGYKREWSEESLTESGWTIGAKPSDFDIPMPRAVEDGGDPDGVVEFAFRAYFLPVPSAPSKLPPNQWAKELHDMLPEEAHGDYDFTKDQVDTGFGCWRIFFLVTKIRYRSESSKPNYTLPADLDDVTSVYADDG